MGLLPERARGRRAKGRNGRRAAVENGQNHRKQPRRSGTLRAVRAEVARLAGRGRNRAGRIPPRSLTRRIHRRNLPAGQRLPTGNPAGGIRPGNRTGTIRRGLPLGQQSRTQTGSAAIGQSAPRQSEQAERQGDEQQQTTHSLAPWRGGGYSGGYRPLRPAHPEFHDGGGL